MANPQEGTYLLSARGEEVFQLEYENDEKKYIEYIQ